MEADTLLRINWQKCDETIQANSIQAILAAAIAGDVANIEAVSCSVQAIESFLLIPSDIIVISKAITISSNQSYMTHPGHELSMPKTISKADDYGYLALASGYSEEILNPKCMTKQVWVEAQSKDKTIGEIIHLFKTNKLYCCKINEIDNEMKQFIRQCKRLFMRNGILYHKSEANHSDRSTMQLVLPEAFRKQAL